MTLRTYQNFDLLIEKVGAVYRARVLNSPAGNATVDFRLPFSPSQLQDILARIGSSNKRHLSTYHTNSNAPASELLTPRAFGTQLFTAVFDGPVGDIFGKSLSRIRDQQAGLRIRLRLSSDAPELADLPWEYLYAPNLKRFLVLSDETPLVRYMEVQLPSKDLGIVPPIHLLVVISTPTGIEPLAVEQEWTHLQAALKQPIDDGQIIVDHLSHATLSALQNRLRQSAVHLLHYIGHGYFDQATGQGGLVLENEHGQQLDVTADKLNILVHDHTALRLVFLNTCEGARSGQADAFAGIAQQLVEQGVPAVLAMRTVVTDKAAISFAQEFYEALAAKCPVDAALAEARKAVALHDVEQGEWGTPTLFSRADDNQLFTLANGLIHCDQNKVTNVTVNGERGTRIDPGTQPKIIRLPPEPPPPAKRRFYDREVPLSDLQRELQPRHGVWLTGQYGCGLTALLHQAANTTVAQAFADGVLCIDGNRGLSEVEDIVQQIYNQCYKDDSGAFIHLNATAAQVELGNLNALFVLDQLQLDDDELAALSNKLATRGAVLVAAQGSAPDTLLDLPLAGLPRSDAIKLVADEARIDTTQPGIAALLDRVCVAVSDLPLPLLLIARLVRRRAMPLAQLVDTVEKLGDREPLARAVRLTLTILPKQASATLAILVQMGAGSATPDTLAATSQLPLEVVETVLKQLIELGFVIRRKERYSVTSGSLGRVLDKLLPRSEQQRRSLVAFFVSAATVLASDLNWLEHEWPNLMTAAETAMLEGLPTEAGALVRAVHPYLVLNGMWASWDQMINLADQAAQVSGDKVLHAWTFHERGTHAGLLGDLPVANTNLAKAHQLRMELGDHAGASASKHNVVAFDLTPPPRPFDGQAGTGATKQPMWRSVVLTLVLIGIVIALLFFYAKPTPTISWSDPADIGYGMPLDATQMNASASVPGTFVYTPPLGTVLQSGMAQPLSVSFTPTDGFYYKSTSKVVYVNVTQVALTVTVAARHKLYGDPDPTPTYTVTPALLPSDRFSGTLSRDEGENVGSYAIQPGSLTAGSNYRLIVQGTLTIDQRPLTVKADGQQKVYGDPDPTLTYTVNPPLDPGDSLNGALARDAGENVGTHAIQQGTLTVGDNYRMTFEAGTLTVSQRPITVRADGQQKAYGDRDPALSPQITSGTLVAGEQLTGALTRAAGENIGTYAIQPGTLTAGDNYHLAFEAGVLTITPRPLTVTSVVQKAYGDRDPALSPQITSGTLVSGEQLTGALTRAAGENVGSYVIQPGTLTAGSNYDLTFEAGVLTIAPQSLTVTSVAQKVYGDRDPALLPQITSGTLVAGDQLTGALSRDAGENVGTYAIQLGTLKVSSNYRLTFVPGALTIAPRPLTVTSIVQKTYGDRDPALSPQITSGNLVAGEQLTGALSRDAGENVGSYAIQQGTLTAGSNYRLIVQGTLKITQRPLTVKANPQQKWRGYPDPALTWQITSGALVAGDQLTGALTRDAGETSGTYAIRQGTLTAGKNYALTFVSDTLTIYSQINSILTPTA